MRTLGYRTTEDLFVGPSSQTWPLYYASLRTVRWIRGIKVCGLNPYTRCIYGSTTTLPKRKSVLRSRGVTIDTIALGAMKR